MNKLDQLLEGRGYGDKQAIIKGIQEDREAKKMKAQIKALRIAGWNDHAAAKEQEFYAQLPGIIDRVNMQLEHGSIESGLIAAGGKFAEWGEGARMLAGKAFGDPLMIANAERDRANREKYMAPLEKARPLATTVGGAAPEVLLPGGAGKSIAGRVVQGALASGAETFVASGGDPIETGMSAIGGGLGQQFGHMVGKGVLGVPPKELPKGVEPADMGPRNVHRSELQKIEDQGLMTTPAVRQNNSQMRTIEQGLSSDPLTARPFVEINEHNQQIYNAQARKAIGLKPTGEAITDDVLQSRADEVSEVYRRIIDDNGRSKHFSTTTPAMDAAAAEAHRQSELGVGTDRKLVGDILQQFDVKRKNQFMTLEDYQTSIKDINKAIRKSTDSQAERVLIEMKQALDDAFDATYGDLPELKQARRHWRHIQDLSSSKALSNRGEFSPARMYNFLNRGNNKITTSGSDLANLSQRANYMNDRFPNSGTATRQAIQMATQSPFGMIRGGIGNIASNAYMTPLGSRMMSGQGIAPSMMTSPTAGGSLYRGGQTVSDWLAPKLGRETGEALPGWLGL